MKKCYLPALAAFVMFITTGCTTRHHEAASPNPRPAVLKVVNRAGDGKKATQCVVRKVDEKSVDLTQEFILLSPGKRTISFTYQKWNRQRDHQNGDVSVKQVVSVSPLSFEAEIESGKVYRLDASGLIQDSGADPHQSMITDGHKVGHLHGKPKTVMVAVK